MLKNKVALLLSFILICFAVIPAFAADKGTAKSYKNYIIDNPYGDVDLDKWGSYKNQLHSHTPQAMSS